MEKTKVPKMIFKHKVHFFFAKIFLTLPPVMYSIPCRPFSRFPWCPRVWSRLAPSVWPGPSSFPSVPAVCGRPGCLCGIPQPCLTLGPGGNIVQYWAIVLLLHRFTYPVITKNSKIFSTATLKYQQCKTRLGIRQWLCVTDTHLIYISIDY